MHRTCTGSVSIGQIPGSTSGERGLLMLFLNTKTAIHTPNGPVNTGTELELKQQQEKSVMSAFQALSTLLPIHTCHMHTFLHTP